MGPEHRLGWAVVSGPWQARRIWLWPTGAGGLWQRTTRCGLAAPCLTYRPRRAQTWKILGSEIRVSGSVVNARRLWAAAVTSPAVASPELTIESAIASRVSSGIALASSLALT